MEDFEHIINLLDKKELSDEEQKDIAALLNKDPELKKYFILYQNLKQAGSKSHPDTDSLGEFILYKNGFDKENKNIIPLVPVIERHIRECNKCREEFKVLNSEFTSIDNFINGSLTAKKKEKQSLISTYLFSPKFAFIKYSFASVAIVALIYFSLLLISSASLSPIQKLADVDEKTDYYITRGRTSDEFQKSMIALENGNYDRTIEFLKQDIQNNLNDETIFYSNYILGLVYLESANADFLGLFPSYNKFKVNEGIKNLKECVAKNQSGEFVNINYDAYYFIGKGFLMLNDKEQAINYLKLVVNNKGSKTDEAKLILNELE